MDYIVVVVIGLVAGLVVGRFLTGNNMTLSGDILFAVTGAVVFAFALTALGLAPDTGAGGKDVMAAIGAIAALFLRRILKTV
jgi:uncharacterized membrane protein YeaQ/YmgE (transglycosylase-associated protein family)